jgi:hypothetical protein
MIGFFVVEEGRRSRDAYAGVKRAGSSRKGQPQIAHFGHTAAVSKAGGKKPQEAIGRRDDLDDEFEQY